MAPQMARARQLGRFDCLNRYHVALEALREAWRSRRFTMDKMYRYARICRVERVMRPYLEILAA